MKKLVLAVLTAALSGLTACGKAPESNAKFAEAKLPLKSIMRTTLSKLDLDPSLPAGAVEAMLTVDLTDKKVGILVSTCPTGAKCIWSGPYYSANLVTDITDSKCHVRVIKAFTDDRPVDGRLTEIEIFDYSQSTCAEVRPAYKIVATIHTAFLDRQNGLSHETHSQLSGNKEFVFAKN